jgi:hypothetical protein
MWLPGNEPPAHLDGSLPGDYGASRPSSSRAGDSQCPAGFDPLGLSVDAGNAKWMQQVRLGAGEVMKQEVACARSHSRWAYPGGADALPVGECVPQQRQKGRGSRPRV